MSDGRKPASRRPSVSKTKLRTALSLAASLFMLGCLGSSGPSLPPDIGATHHESAGSDDAARARRDSNVEPIPIGTELWCNHRGTGFFFRAVVVEHREDGQHRVIYADGDQEWVSPRALIGGEPAGDTRVSVRSDLGGEFVSAVTGRRLGAAVYLRYASGDEGWSALTHVRFQRGDLVTDTDEPALGAGSSEENVTGLGQAVLVDYRLQGLRFAAVLTARREDSTVHVVYLDGQAEWVDPRAVIEDTLSEGDVVHVRRTWEPAVWVRGRITQRVGFAFRVELDDGGHAWTSLFRLRVPTEATAATEPPPSEAPSTT